MRCEAQWGIARSSLWQPATIVGVHDDGCVDVVYDDGVRLEGIHRP